MIVDTKRTFKYRIKLKEVGMLQIICFGIYYHFKIVENEEKHRSAIVFVDSAC